MESRNGQKALAPREERTSRFQITRMEERIAPGGLGSLIDVDVRDVDILNHSLNNNRIFVDVL
jgi:hypothetical protein